MPDDDFLARLDHDDVALAEYFNGEQMAWKRMDLAILGTLRGVEADQKRGSGRRDQQPPTEQQVWALINAARELASPAFAAWLQVGAFRGMRPGELDACDRNDFRLSARPAHAATHAARDARLHRASRTVSPMSESPANGRVFVVLGSADWTPGVPTGTKAPSRLEGW
jgi:hypothetical protein